MEQELGGSGLAPLLQGTLGAQKWLPHTSALPCVQPERSQDSTFHGRSP